MFDVLLIAIAIWAAAGVQATVRAAFAGNAPTNAPAFPITYGTAQRVAYRRWRARFRRGMPGRADGHRPGHVVADGLAAVFAGAALFASGFVSGVAWATGHHGTRAATGRVRGAARGSRPTPGPGPRTDGRPRPDDVRPRKSPPTEPVFDGELLDDDQPRTGTADPGDVIDVEVIDPELTTPARPALRDRPEPEGTPMTEILNIHQLFAWAKSAAQAAAKLGEEASIRRTAAAARAESAALVAQTAASHAAQLEATRARFAGLNMDAASLAAITTAIGAAGTLAAAEQRRADAERLAAECAAASASAAEAYQVAVAAMHDTVQAHQAPHAMAQAETGNAAAHASVLAVS